MTGLGSRHGRHGRGVGDTQTSDLMTEEKSTRVKIRASDSSIARIKASPFIPNKSSVRGFVYDAKTGKLNEVGLPAGVA